MSLSRKQSLRDSAVCVCVSVCVSRGEGGGIDDGPISRMCCPILLSARRSATYSHWGSRLFWFHNCVVNNFNSCICELPSHRWRHCTRSPGCYCGTGCHGVCWYVCKRCSCENNVTVKTFTRGDHCRIIRGWSVYWVGLGRLVDHVVRSNRLPDRVASEGSPCFVLSSG